ncbi:hypothetical protein [Halopseudomonas yangmingensis]|uniref:Uncharacterized protein n=1 Tax=Halopseudomonas yangmingensis TaxID=1720063 RepID=A0A1I4RI10_9GAMM|nr:hypothetical protein [Halopseudomonas yangmingensis]SFM51891.1 hypothetical protein SAMN05216217_1078 [Halopseudomonas yangmingensis]
MKKIFYALVFTMSFVGIIVSNNAFALNNAILGLRDFTDLDALPEAMTCRKIIQGQYGHITCRLGFPDETRVLWDSQRGANVRIFTFQNANCVDGECYIDNRQVGYWNGELKPAIPFGYFIQTTSDGMPVVYRHDKYQEYSSQNLSYVQVGDLLHKWLRRTGRDEEGANRIVGAFYEGGVDKYLQDKKGGNKPSAITKVTEAWCNPRMDDECYINNEPVSIDDLHKYLPYVDEDKVDAAGGTCDYPICYDKNHKPVGLRR